MKTPVIIGIAGGTGSGKTTVAQKVLEKIDSSKITIIEHDSYYKDQSKITFEERLKTNYDHPLAFDTDLLLKHLTDLRAGKPIQRPVYSFKSHTRLPEAVTEEPKKIIILEGILILEDKRIRDLMDIKVYVDTDPDVRIIRRIVRDIKERERTLESVVDQYLSVVRPMHLQFVEPSKKFADIIVPEGGENKVAIDILTAKIISLVNSH
ncbi:uridine kinase [Proteinivorax hydrogeniformans]|uniref:Uridine kinase n=1 Tax=Proteinivorax hydrogeniformans TaxID=1826727 RepID=A0AAU8HRE1_9FIRM